ncbi:unnamed protein product [Sphagnum jensenii]|uniref:Peroxisomal membrane protein MPV17 n=1 Tax=Sphagnum jensenii TaxID=128206 RepID=A0ABP1ANP0_9BRYO
MGMGGGWQGMGGSSLPWKLGNFRVPAGGGAARAQAADAAGGMQGDESSSISNTRRARFPLKAALTAGVLATTGDTIAQLYERWNRRKALEKQAALEEIEVVGPFNHDWLRAMRMASYGFLIYGPFSQVWYEVLDHLLPAKNLTNLSLKVVANQVVLGPCVIALVFAWNSLWQGRLEHLPEMYRTRALSTLIDGWKFWFPASILNFGLVPLQARVAFMSSCSIFWNFYLSITMTASKPAITASKAD